MEQITNQQTNFCILESNKLATVYSMPLTEKESQTKVSKAFKGDFQLLKSRRRRTILHQEA